MTAQVVYIYPTHEPPPVSRRIPGEFLNTPLREQTWCLWNACHRARRGNAQALLFLRDLVRARPSDRMACVAGGTLASLGHDWVLETHRWSR